MKTIKKNLLGVGLMILCISNTFANNVPEGELTSVKKVIQEIFSDPHTFDFSEDIYARVEIIVNKHNEMLVLNVECADAQIEKYIRKKINYRKLPGLLKKRHYMFPVRMMKE